MIRDSLVTQLTLRTGATTVTLTAGAIVRMALDVTQLGFTATLEAVVSSELEDDPLIRAFSTSDLLQARLTVESAEPDPNGDAREPLLLDGVVTEKAVSEVVGEARVGRPVIGRRYRLTVLDPAQAYWRQHFPTEVYVDATLHAVFEAQRCGGLSLSYAWPLLEDARPIIALGLGRDIGGPSFYDFVLWLVDTAGGVLEYDSTANTYRLAAKKSVGLSPATLLADDLADVDVAIGLAPRAELRLLNATTAAAEQRIPRPDTVTGVHEDVLVCTRVPADLARLTTTTKASRRPVTQRLAVTFARFPRTTLRPGKLVVFDEAMSPSLQTTKNSYRVTRFSVEAAHAPRDGDALAAEPEDTEAVYDLSVHAMLEPRGDSALDLPPYLPPRYPFQVEGKVVSEGGPVGTRTWAVAEDDKTSQLFQQVDLPLFNKKVRVPFEAGELPGYFFFPPYKAQLAVVDLYFDAARIVGFVDFADEARAAQDAQNQAIAFGKKAADGTLLNFEYAEQKPKLTLVRTLDNDVQKLSLTEGTITLDVRQTSMTPALEPTYDVTPNVAAAKSKLVTAVTGSIEDVTASFGSGLADVSTTLTTTTEEVDQKLVTFETSLTVRVATARAELEALTGALRESADEIETAINDAKAAILAAALS